MEDGAVDAAGRSTQLPEDTWDYGKTGAKEPPYNLVALCVFLEINTWHYRCVETKAISANVVTTNGPTVFITNFAASFLHGSPSASDPSEPSPRRPQVSEGFDSGVHSPPRGSFLRSPVA